MAYHGRHRQPAQPRSRAPLSRPLLAGGLALGLGASALTYAAATDLPVREAALVAGDVSGRQPEGTARTDGAQADGLQSGSTEMVGLHRQSAAAVSRSERRTALTGAEARAASAAAARQKAVVVRQAKAKQAAAAARAKATAKAAADAKRKAAAAKAKQQLIADARHNPKAVAKSLMAAHGWTSQEQFRCLVTLWNGESDWRWSAENPSSGAYGIPQSLPGRKMARFGNDWRTNPVTQISWGLWYIDASYGSPCNALSFWNSKSPHWY